MTTDPTPRTVRWSELAGAGWHVTSWFGHAGDHCIAAKGRERMELRGLNAEALVARDLPPLADPTLGPDGRTPLHTRRTVNGMPVIYTANGWRRAET